MADARSCANSLFFVLKLAFIVIALATIALGVFDLLQKHWFTYCLFEFGLWDAWYISNNYSVTINDLHDTLCGNLSIGIEVLCPKFCSNIRQMQACGIVMIVLGSVSLAMLAALTALHVLLLCGKSLRKRTVQVFVLLPCVFWAAGLVAYACVTTRKDFSDTSAGADDLRWETGYQVSVAVGALAALAAALGVFANFKNSE